MSSETVPVVESHNRRWYSLPDDIFTDIISRLGFPPDVVITISTTNFIIQQTVGRTYHELNYYKPTYDLYEFWGILDNLFTFFIPPFIDTFTLDIHAEHYKEPRCWPIIDGWARQLRSSNVQHFTVKGIRRCRSDDHLYPLSIFRMQSLVSLKLHLLDNKIESGFPRSILLPNLKKLTLDWIDYEFLKRLLTYCPSLEDLTFSVDTNEERLVFKSEKLKRLCIALEGFSIRDFIIQAPILEKLDYYSATILSMQMLDSISNVKSLAIHVSSRKIDLGLNKTMMFPNLTRLYLVVNLPEIFKAIGLKLHCPNLKVFELRLERISKMVWDEEAVFVPVEHVKHIKLYPSYYLFDTHIFKVLRLLLRSAKVLKKLTIKPYDRHSFDEHFYRAKPQSFYEALFECVKATSRCQLELLDAYKRPNENLLT